MSLPFVFCLAGDSYLIDQKRAEIISQIRNSVPGEIAESGYRLSEGMLERALRDAQTLPFLIQYQIFRMRETDGLRKHELEMLEAYFKTPVRTTYLIFEAEALSAKQG